MNMLKKTVERAQQSVGETLGSTHKTEYDADVQALIANVEDIRLQTSALLAACNTNVQPNPTVDLITTFKPDALNPPESLAKTADTYASKIQASHADTSKALSETANAYKEVGAAQRAYQLKTRDVTLAHLRQLLDVSIGEFNQDKASLHNKRLDLDSAKNRKKQDEAEVAKYLAEYQARQEKVRTLGRSIVEKNGAELKAQLHAYMQAEAEYHQAAYEKLNKAISTL